MAQQEQRAMGGGGGGAMDFHAAPSAASNVPSEDARKERERKAEYAESLRLQARVLNPTPYTLHPTFLTLHTGAFSYERSAPVTDRPLIRVNRIS